MLFCFRTTGLIIMFKKIAKILTTPRISYQPLVEVRIYKDSILHNLRQYQKRYPKLAVAPVLKSNAYGHGLIQIAKILGQESLPFFVVDSFYEALTLRQERVKNKILILGFTSLDQVNKGLENCSFGITSLENLKIISKNLKSKRAFHLKIDTGMHRLGILTSEIQDALRLIKKNKNIILEGLCTHLADSENENVDFTNQQMTEWNKSVKIFRENFSAIKYFHVANTAGTRIEGIDANVARVGIGLYGIDTAPKARLDLKPALEMVCVIASIKNINPKDKIGYSLTYEATRPMRIAIAPVGYYEGVDRRLSNKGSFIVGNKPCKIVGRVSMNMTAIDISMVPGVKLGESVLVISRNLRDKNSVENIAKICNSLEREILVHIPASLRRVVI
jgi:alanine racemase